MALHPYDRDPYRSPDVVLAEAHRMADDIRRRAQRDANDVRRAAAEWASATRRDAEEYRYRVVADIERAREQIAGEQVAADQIPGEQIPGEQIPGETAAAQDVIDLRATGEPAAGVEEDPGDSQPTVRSQPRPEPGADIKLSDAVRQAVRRRFLGASR